MSGAFEAGDIVWVNSRASSEPRLLARVVRSHGYPNNTRLYDLSFDDDRPDRESVSGLWLVPVSAVDRLAALAGDS